MSKGLQPKLTTFSSSWLKKLGIFLIMNHLFKFNNLKGFIVKLWFQCTQCKLLFFSVDTLFSKFALYSFLKSKKTSLKIQLFIKTCSLTKVVIIIMVNYYMWSKGIPCLKHPCKSLRVFENPATGGKMHILPVLLYILTFRVFLTSLNAMLHILSDLPSRKVTPQPRTPLHTWAPFV